LFQGNGFAICYLEFLEILLKMKIKIDDIVDQLEVSLDTGNSYLNKLTGELYYISDEIFGYLDGAEEEDTLEDLPDWESDLVKVAKEINETNNYVQLPGKFELNEYRMMEKFCLSITDERLRDEMYYSIKGSGAFRRFKDNIHRHGIEKDWFAFKSSELCAIAIDWCQSNNLEFDDRKNL